MKVEINKESITYGILFNNLKMKIKNNKSKKIKNILYKTFNYINNMNIKYIIFAKI